VLSSLHVQAAKSYVKVVPVELTVAKSHIETQLQVFSFVQVPDNVIPVVAISIGFAET
jgi:phosphoribosylcarboxyaminoimidazole (NCAIR) mutase